MAISNLLDTKQTTLSTAATAVTLPATFTNGDQLTTSVTLSCLNTSGNATTWVMLDSATDSEGQTYPASPINISYRANPGKTLFFAKTSSGGGTLEASVWG